MNNLKTKTNGDYVSVSQEVIFEKLNTSHKGLTEQEAQKRLEEYGFNEPAKKKKRTVLIQILSKFVNPLVIVLLVIAIRSTTIMGWRLGLCGTVLPAMAILAVTLLAAIHTRLQGILITGAGITLFVAAMLLVPRFKIDRLSRTALPGALPAGS